MALNFVSATVADGCLIAQVKSEYQGEAEIRATLGTITAIHGGAKGPNISVDHQFGCPYLSISGILISLIRDQEQVLYDLLGVQPLPDAPDCPTHKGVKMESLSAGTWACGKCTSPTVSGAPAEAVPHVA